MKFLVAIAVFIATIALSTQTLAKVKPGHKDAIATSAKTTPVAAPQENAASEKQHNTTGHIVAGESGLHVKTQQHTTEHMQAHGGLPEKMNSLFPPKEADLAKSTRPSIVEIKAPSFLSTVTSGPVKLEWNAATGATDYHVQIATDPNFKWLVVNEKFVKETVYNFSAEAGKRYFWRVAGYNSGNTSSFAKSNFVSSALNVK